MPHSRKMLILLSVAFIPSNAAQPTDTVVEPSFVPDPPGRGTVGLLVSSVLTIILCLWTAIHVNVLENPTTGKILLRKLHWVLFGLLAPELVLWCAFGQWREACSILRAVTEARLAEAGQAETVAPVSEGIIERFSTWWNSPPLVHDFDMDSAFFVVMGGFTIGPRGFPNRQLTVTPAGLITLLEHRIVLPQTLDRCKRDIVDKAKADMLSKFLVCTQGSWLIIQCIARSAQGLPITLLEIHIMLHVVCTVIMYLFWWNKPFDAGRSLALEIDDQVAALLCYGSEFRQTGSLYVSRTVPGPLWPGVPVSTRGDNPKMADLPGFVRYGAFPSWESLKQMSGLNKRGNGVIGFDRQALVNREKGFYVKCKSEMAFVSDPLAEMEFYTFLADVIRSSPENRTLIGKPIMELRDRDYSLVAATHRGLVQLCFEAGDFFPNFSSSSVIVDGAAPCLIIELLALLYGGAHAACWNGHFPTDQERLLWRLSAIVVMFPLVPMVPVVIRVNRGIHRMLAGTNNNLPEIPNTLYERMIDKVAMPITTLTAILLMFGYLVARLFLVVESFISVRSLPAGSYMTPEWENFWPHL